jgi:hypothetical protein
MDRVFSPSSKSIDNVATIALAILSQGDHIGILYYKDDESTVSLLHLGWHLQLRNDPPTGTNIPDLWIDPAINPNRALHLEACFRLIWDKNKINSIPYAFSRPTGVFHTDGSIVNDPSFLGLTCATFVLAVFDYAKLPLLQDETWVARDDDEKWQNDMVEIMATRNVPEEHLACIRDSIPAIRFRPLEVAGAAAAVTYPVPFDTAIEYADRIKELLC